MSWLQAAPKGCGGFGGLKREWGAPPQKWAPAVPARILSRSPHFGRGPVSRQLPLGGLPPRGSLGAPGGCVLNRARPFWGPCISAGPRGLCAPCRKAFFHAGAAASPVDPLRRLWPPGSQGRGVRNHIAQENKGTPKEMNTIGTLTYETHRKTKESII